MPHQLPQGFRAAGVYTRVKRNTSKLDLSLIVSDRPAVAAGVYTQNVVCGAPVVLGRERTPSDSMRAVVINSGVANACTGEQGLRDAHEMAHRTAEACDLEQENVLVMSTGLIGEMLPMDKINPGIAAAAAVLSDSDEALVDAARGMLTTDSTHKIRSRALQLDSGKVLITGIAKGAAMIGPNMATMLAVIMTDAALTVEAAQAGLKDAVDESFNCISVDGHTSTSDTVLLLANGAAGGKVLSGSDLGQVPGDAGRGLRRPGAVDSCRRRRGHASHHRRGPRVQNPQGCRHNRQDYRRQSFGEDCSGRC